MTSDKKPERIAFFEGIHQRFHLAADRTADRLFYKSKFPVPMWSIGFLILSDRVAAKTIQVHFMLSVVRAKLTKAR